MAEIKTLAMEAAAARTTISNAVAAVVADRANYDVVYAWRPQLAAQVVALRTVLAMAPTVASAQTDAVTGQYRAAFNQLEFDDKSVSASFELSDQASTSGMDTDVWMYCSLTDDQSDPGGQARGVFSNGRLRLRDGEHQILLDGKFDTLTLTESSDVPGKLTGVVLLDRLTGLLTEDLSPITVQVRVVLTQATGNIVDFSGDLNLQGTIAWTPTLLTCADVLDAGYRLIGDANGDCRVDIEDFSQFAAAFGECNDPEDPNCPNPF